MLRSAMSDRSSLEGAPGAVDEAETPAIEGVVEAMTSPLVVLDREFRFVFVNREAERLYDLPRAELLGRVCWDVFPGLRGSDVDAHYTRAMTERISVRFEVFYPPWQRWFDVHAYPVERGGIGVGFRDTTDRKRSEAVLSGQARALAAAVDARPLDEVLALLVRTVEVAQPGLVASILLLDDDGLHLRNGAAPGLPEQYSRALDGLAIGPTVGSCGTAAYTGRTVVADDIATDPLWAATPTFRDLAIAHGLRACWSVPIRSTPGRVLGTFALYRTEPGSPAPEEHERVQLLAHTAALVIEAARGRESTRRAKEAAERANRSKDEFLAMLGHELRTPLAPIVTALQLMAMREREPSTERAIIERQVKHLERLVDDLLDVSRITTGKIELRREPVTVDEVAAGAIELAQPLMAQRRHRFTTELQPGLVVYADPFRLAQVLGNLLVNAAKYTDPGGHVELSVEQRGDRVVMVVRDDGIGLASDALASVFELFQQEGVAADAVTGGLGLGLAIVRSLVELHDGTVRAQSDGPGKGSQFIVELPVATIESRASTVPSADPARAAPRRILVVDDNEDTAQMMALVLTELGHTVRVATNGRGALEMLERFTPDVALLDIGLPDMDGYVLAERLRATRHGAKLILVAVTGYGQDADRQRALSAGFAAHVVKPVDLGRLSELLDRVGRAD